MEAAIQRKMNLLILIRGVPGAGKSTLAELIHDSRMSIGKESAWLEADQFFIQPDGTYKFDKARIQDAHAWCKERTKLFMSLGTPQVIVSNTFCQDWQIEPYYRLALKFEYRVQEIILRSEFGSIHNIPEETMEKFRKNFKKEVLNG